jgi:iron complex transport system ATP-binding protein
MEPLLSCRGLSCGYPSRTVLEGVDLDLFPGTVTALLGPNGSGKSTLLKTLCRTLPILQGEASLAGDPLGSLEAVETARRIAYVPQEEEPRFAFPVREMVALGRLPHSRGLFDTGEDLEATARAMSDADCVELADRPVTELSGGERQRVLLARALAQDAPVLLLDEPTSHLDVGYQVAAIDLLRRLAQGSRAILVAVHDLNLASLVADQAVLLSGGGIVLSGPIEEVLRDPRLDRTYGIAFERILGKDGLLRVYPVYEAEHRPSVERDVGRRSRR